MYRSLLAVLASSSLLAALSVPARADDVGLRILTQTWTPWTDDDSVSTVIDDPTFLSQTLSAHWSAKWPRVDGALTNFLGQGDLITDGVTLYDIDLTVPEPNFSLTNRGYTNGGLGLEAKLQFDGMHFEATSTTPSAEVLGIEIGAGEYADPRCSIDLDLEVTVPMGVGTDVSAPLFTTITPGEAATRPILEISNLRVDSRNWSCAVIVGLMDVLDLDDVLTDLVTDPNSPVVADINSSLIDLLDDYTTNANTLISGAVPSGLGHIDAWKDPHLLTLAFSVDPSVFPADGLNNGTVHGAYASADGRLQCGDLPISIARKTGPRPIINPSGALGDIPTEPLEIHYACASDGLSYTLGGLSQTFPTLVNTYSQVDCSTADADTDGRLVTLDGIPSRLMPYELEAEYPILSHLYTFPCGGAEQVPGPPPTSQDDIRDPLLDPDYEFEYTDWWMQGWAYTATGIDTQVVLVPVSFNQYNF